jgi:hypothetical protein
MKENIYLLPSNLSLSNLKDVSTSFQKRKKWVSFAQYTVHDSSLLNELNLEFN